MYPFPNEQTVGIHTYPTSEAPLSNAFGKRQQESASVICTMFKSSEDEGPYWEPGAGHCVCGWPSQGGASPLCLSSLKASKHWLHSQLLHALENILKFAHKVVKEQTCLGGPCEEELVP